jgi:seryl-tRNA synthetase
MEKLIVEINYSDGYTYSFSDHLPVLFSSKEEFIITLEEKVESILKELEELKKISDKKQEELHKIFSRLRDKKLNEKEREKINQELKPILEENGKLVCAEKEKEKFTLGGQTFHIESFTYVEDGKTTIVLPEVQTLEEYFQEVTFNFKE